MIILPNFFQNITEDINYGLTDNTVKRIHVNEFSFLFRVSGKAGPHLQEQSGI